MREAREGGATPPTGRPPRADGSKPLHISVSVHDNHSLEVKSAIGIAKVNAST